MIVKKNWTSRDEKGKAIRWTGYFLFGFIPLYINRELIG
jgi:hypothetical protein